MENIVHWEKQASSCLQWSGVYGDELRLRTTLMMMKASLERHWRRGSISGILPICMARAMKEADLESAGALTGRKYSWPQIRVRYREDYGTYFDGSPAYLKQAVEASLKRLKTDVIDCTTRTA